MICELTILFLVKRNAYHGPRPTFYIQLGSDNLLIILYLVKNSYKVV